MSDPTIEKENCEKCGVDVRENTQFCYNCGTPRENFAEVVADSSEPVNGNEADVETKAALEGLAAKFKVADDTTDNEKLAQAADERRKARVVKRQPKQFVWEPADDISGLGILLFAIFVAVTAGVIVLITLYWR
jgi:hypothetical protein